MDRRLNNLERALDFVTASSINSWLYANRAERMDANLTIFDERRRRFHLVRYQFAVSYVTGKVVADVACGTGYGSAFMGAKGRADRVIGVDIDPQATRYAREHYESANVSFICSSGEATELETATFDIVTSFETVEHVPSDQALLKEFARILKPNGQLLISTPNDWGLTPYHVRSQDMDVFKRLLTTSGFVINALFNQNSGSDTIHNHRQPEGMTPTTSENSRLAECYLAVCSKI